MTRKASTFRIDPPMQSALENLSRVLKRPMNQLVNEALSLYLDKRSREVERDLEAIVLSLRVYRKRDPRFKEAIAAAVDAEAGLGGQDPSEGTVVIGRLENGQLAEEGDANPLRAEIRGLLNAP